MPRYSLRTLLILMAILPPMLWFGWWQWTEYKARQARRQELLNRLEEIARAYDVGTIYANAVSQVLAEKAKREAAEAGPEPADPLNRP
jgi:hypothetical protein